MFKMPAPGWANSNEQWGSGMPNEGFFVYSNGRGTQMTQPNYVLDNEHEVRTARAFEQHAKVLVLPHNTGDM